MVAGWHFYLTTPHNMNAVTARGPEARSHTLVESSAAGHQSSHEVAVHGAMSQELEGLCHNPPVELEGCAVDPAQQVPSVLVAPIVTVEYSLKRQAQKLHMKRTFA